MQELSSLSKRDRVAMLRLPDRPPPGTRSRSSWLPWALCFLLAFSTVSLLVRSGRGASPGRTATPMEIAQLARSVAEPGPSAAAAPAPAAGATVLESKGYIVAAHQIQVSPIEVAGRIVEIYVEEGKRFKKGEVLARLDDESYRAEHREAAANLRQMRARRDELKAGSRPEEIQQAAAELRESEEAMKQARLEYERNKNLTNGALSPQEFEKVQYVYMALVQRVKKLERQYELVKIGPRRERIEAAEAEVMLAEARFAKAQWRLDNCVIRAPVDGTILKKTAEIGNLASPMSFNAISQSICDMADLGDLEAELEIPERDISKIIKGMPCKVTTDAYPNRTYDGTVDRLMPIALQNKAAIQVRVKLSVPKEEEGKYLKPGMNTRVTFLQPAAKP